MHCHQGKNSLYETFVHVEIISSFATILNQLLKIGNCERIISSFFHYNLCDQNFHRIKTMNVQYL